MRTGEGYRTQARVLVADWDRNHALSLAAAMHRAGLTTATAFNGKEAVEKAETFRPQLLVTEAYLGRLSGIHAAAHITAALPDCKVLFVSGEASFADIAHATPEGVVYSYKRKPIDANDLLNIITCLLSNERPGGRTVATERDTAQPAARKTRVRAGQIAAARQEQYAGAIFDPALL
jgi:two-component system OmpR family response regulator